MNLALSLVGYEKDVEAAISYVFGASFVCDTQDNAKAVSNTFFNIVMHWQFNIFNVAACLAKKRG